MGNKMEERLHILWTNSNLNTAHKMVFMYGINAKKVGWWEEVTIIIWGDTARLVAEDEGIQEKIKMALHVGVKVSACIACATEFGVVEQLEAQGIELIPWGLPLTELIKGKAPLITI